MNAVHEISKSKATVYLFDKWNIRNDLKREPRKFRIELVLDSRWQVYGTVLRM